MSAACFVSWPSTACWSASSCNTPKPRPRAERRDLADDCRAPARSTRYALLSAAPRVEDAGAGHDAEGRRLAGDLGGAHRHVGGALLVAGDDRSGCRRRRRGRRRSRRSAPPGRQNSVSMPARREATSTTWAATGGDGSAVAHASWSSRALRRSGEDPTGSRRERVEVRRWRGDDTCSRRSTALHGDHPDAVVDRRRQAGSWEAARTPRRPQLGLAAVAGAPAVWRSACDARRSPR